MKRQLFGWALVTALASLSAPQGTGGTSQDAELPEPTVCVIGEIAKPGCYAFKDDLTVGDVIKQAGGASRYLALQPYRITRLRRDGLPVRCDADPRTPLKPADQITIAAPDPPRRGRTTKPTPMCAD